MPINSTYQRRWNHKSIFLPLNLFVSVRLSLSNWFFPSLRLNPLFRTSLFLSRGLFMADNLSLFTIRIPRSRRKTIYDNLWDNIWTLTSKSLSFCSSSSARSFERAQVMSLGCTVLSSKNSLIRVSNDEKSSKTDKNIQVFNGKF